MQLLQNILSEWAVKEQMCSCLRVKVTKKHIESYKKHTDEEEKMAFFQPGLGREPIITSFP